jgi:hypothetical protein
MTLGYAAAKRGGEDDRRRARAHLDFFRAEAGRESPRAAFTAVHELGFALRVEARLPK